MKMAKASKEEWERVMKFTQELQEEIDYPSKSNSDFGLWVRNNMPPMTRTVFGYQVLVDNCCDPDSHTLEWKPEIAKAMSKAKV